MENNYQRRQNNGKMEEFFNGLTKSNNRVTGESEFINSDQKMKLVKEEKMTDAICKIKLHKG